MLAVLGSGLLALGIGWAAAGHALAPVRAIARTASRITEQRLDARVRMDPAHPPDELHELADTVDAMLDRLAPAWTRRSASWPTPRHELRTPLTVIRTEAEVALDDPGATPADLRRALAVTVEGPSARRRCSTGCWSSPPPRRRPGATSRSTSRPPPRRALAQAAPGAGADLRPRPGARRRRPAGAPRRRTSARTPSATATAGPPSTCAPSATPPWSASPTPARSIAPDTLARLTDPFERGDRAAPRGAGLGLSIVRAVAEAHGGHLHLSAPPAGGLVAEVRLPAVTGT